MYAEREGDRILLRHESREREAVKLLPGKAWDRVRSTWSVPLSWAACLQLRGVFGDGLAVGPELAAWSLETKARVDYLLWLRAQTDAAGDADLWGFQRVAVEFLVQAGRALLGDEMGSGKTRTAARALRRLREEGLLTRPALVVCPKSVKRAWKRELGATGFRVAVAGATKKQRLEALDGAARGDVDVLVMNWDQLRAHSRLEAFGSVRLAKCAECDPRREDPVKEASCESHARELNALDFGAVVFDEVHRAADAKSKQTRAAKAAVPEARFRWGLSGTPLPDNPEQLWSVMNLLVPEEYPAKSAFVDRYCLVGLDPYGYREVLGVLPETAAELFGFLDARFLRRLKAETLPWLPDKLPVTRYVEMKPAQRKTYRELAEGGIAEVAGGDVLGTNPLVLASRLSQLASASLEVNEDGDVRLCEPSPKVDGLVELLEDLGDKPVVAYSPSRQLLELVEARLTKLGIPWVSIHGGVTEDGRDDAEARFADGRARVMLLNDAGGEGLTLTRADTFVYLQRSWSLRANSQVEDRVHRPGAEVHDKIFVVDLVTEDTIEDYMHERLVEKGERIQDVLRDEERLLAALRGT